MVKLAVGGEDVLIGPADALAEPHGLMAWMDTPNAFCSIIDPFVNDEPQEEVLNVWVIDDGIVACV